MQGNKTIRGEILTGAQGTKRSSSTENNLKQKNLDFNKNISPDIIEVEVKEFSEKEASETLLLLSNHLQTPTR